MAISQKKYVDITSGIGGEAQASRRELIGRVLTTNAKVPVQSALEFTSADNVSSYFGSESNEAKFAGKYFSFISKNGIKANKISFARYAETAVSPYISSTKTFSGVSQFLTIDDGSFVLTIGDTSETVDSLDFSSVTSLTDVATVINTALGNLSQLSSAMFAYSNGAFVLTGGASGNISISVSQADSGTNILGLIGFDSASMPIISNGHVAESPVECMIRTTANSDNYGSFCFLSTLTSAQIQAVAEWNKSKNVMFLYSAKADSATLSANVEATSGMTGTGLTYDAHNAYAEFMPMAIFGSTAYNSGRPATKNFMYQMFDSEQPSVTDDALSQSLDALKVNYLGQTSQAGTTISFYQDGVLQGDISDMGVYCNEIWLKDALKTEFLNLLLGLEQLPANDAGRGFARGCVQNVLDEALVNGVIMAGKALTSTQKAYITSLTNDIDAWRDVETLGYWLDVDVLQYVENDIVKYKINYLLVYSKGDSIRKVEGTDILI